MSTNKHIKNPSGLIVNGLVDGEILQSLEKVTEKFSVSISQGIYNNPSAEVLEQYVPAVEELTVSDEELADPIGDEVHTPIKGITHRYPDRVLLKAVHVCEVYCRFCFRREKVGRGKEILSQQELNSALKYIENNNEIFEVILSGGDPLVMHPDKLREIINRLSNIEHIAVIRIHTRLPMASPEKVTEKLLKALDTEKAVFVVLHCNSHKELTSEVKVALRSFLKEGIPLLSQSVLLKGINDSGEKLEKLFRLLIANRVKPYYLHHPDKAQGTAHFRVPISKGVAITKSLRGKVSGLCQPSYVLDIPGGKGKVPLGYNYLRQNDENYKVEDWQGICHDYKD